MEPTNSAEFATVLETKLYTLNIALANVSSINQGNIADTRSLFNDLLALVLQSAPIWTKNLSLCNAVLAIIHMAIVLMPSADQIRLRRLFDPRKIHGILKLDIGHTFVPRRFACSRYASTSNQPI